MERVDLSGAGQRGTRLNRGPLFPFGGGAGGSWQIKNKK